MLSRNVTICSGVVVLIACMLACSTVCAGEGGVLDETPAERNERMEWWRDGRFGMFIHWGLYAELAGEYKGKRISGIGEWIMHRANIPVEEYEKLVPRFNPVKFDARQWARIARKAGMKYMVITSKHHDGFCLWDSELTDYDIMSTPFKRDILKELSKSCRAEGIRFCFYHSIMDWHNPDQKNDFPAYKKYLFGQVEELLTDYGPTGVMWFDGEWIKQWNRKLGRELHAFCMQLQPELIVNNRVGKRHREDGDFGTPEQTIPATGIPGYDWETCMTMNNTWGWKHYDNNWKSTEDLLHKLVDIASKGGNFLLNVGPTPEGEIPAPSVERLAAMGEWLAVNGESIYGTSASPLGKLQWGRCTAKPGRLYLHVFNWPEGDLRLKGLANEVNKVSLLASKDDSELDFRREDVDLLISLPEKAPDPVDTVIAVDFEGEIEVDTSIRQGADGTVALTAADAVVHGGTAQYESGNGKDSIGFWTDKNDWVGWEFKVKHPGSFTVEVTYACANGSGGSRYQVIAGDEKLSGTVEETGDWTRYVTVKLDGTIEIAEEGKHTLDVKPVTKPGLAVMNLKSVILKPIEE